MLELLNFKKTPNVPDVNSLIKTLVSAIPAFHIQWESAVHLTFQNFHV